MTSRWEEAEVLGLDAANRTDPYRIFLVAGEHSGDALGGKLMAALNARLKGRVRYLGVGGAHMEAQGLVSQFPLSDVAVMGPLAILKRLPRIISRVYGAVGAVVAAEPDVLVIIDSPEFTHPIAKRVRQRSPGIPIVDYVCPSVWAWRPGRARAMRPYVDHVLALLPFEPGALARLKGPAATYVGHPLIERLPWLDALDVAPLAARLALNNRQPILVVLPGSRVSEVTRLLPVFADAVGRLVRQGWMPQVLIPTVPSVRALIEAHVPSWPVLPHLLTGEDDKFRAFKLATAALAASGTVTLELGLAGTPTVVAYRVDGIASRLRFLLKVPSVVLTNLVLEESVYPEFLQEACTGENLAAAIDLLFQDTPQRARQISSLKRLPVVMKLPSGVPSEKAADVVIRMLET